MTITTITAPSTSLLTTVSRVQAELGIEGDEVLLLALIRVATAAIEKYTSRKFAEERIAETFGVEGPTTQFFLTRHPIVALHSLTFNGALVDAAVYEVSDAEAGELFMAQGFTPTPIRVQGITLWTEGRVELLYEANYTAGYILPDAGPASPSPNLPADIEQAAVETVKARWQQKPRDSSVKSERIGDYAATYADPTANASGLPPAAMALVESYRKVVW